MVMTGIPIHTLLLTTPELGFDELDCSATMPFHKILDGESTSFKSSKAEGGAIFILQAELPLDKP